jgi:hypothetical protein
MHRIALLAVFATAMFAQNATKPAPKPPAGIDEALRARITEFFQYHITEEYRKAEKLVAEDSQDFYYVHNKPHYLTFEITNIEYLDNFTKAKVRGMAEQYFHGPGFEGRPLKAPSTSTWKLIDGKWFWYVDADELAKGPFGKMANAGSKATSASAGQMPPIPTSIDFVLNQVKLDKTTVVLMPNETQELTVTNTAPGEMKLTLTQTLPGIEVTLDKSVLKSGEKAVVILKSDDNPHSGTMAFRVDPTGETLSWQVKRQ